MAFGFLEQQRRPAFLQGAVANLGDLEIRIHARADALQLALFFQLRKEIAQIVIFHGASRGSGWTLYMTCHGLRRKDPWQTADLRSILRVACRPGDTHEDKFHKQLTRGDTAMNYLHSPAMFFSGWFLGVWVIALVVFILYLITLMNTLNAVSPANRRMTPGLVFLLLIPLFNLVWNFLVVTKIRDSLQAEFSARNLSGQGFGYGMGLAMCILYIVALLPVINLLAAPAALVCWIIYWVQIAGYKGQLSKT